MKLSEKLVTNFCLNLIPIILSSLLMASELSITEQLNCPEGFYTRNHPWIKKLSQSQIRLEPYRHSCLPCNCNPLGSLSTTCNKGSGTCYCIEGYVGLKCNKCASGFVEIENEKFGNNISTRCEKCEECYKNLLIQLEELKSNGIELIRKASYATKSRVVIMKQYDGKVVHLLNSSVLQISENLQPEPVDLDGLIQQLDTSFLETKEYSDKLSQMTKDLENFLNIRTDQLNTNFDQIEYLISNLNLMEDILDGHIHSFTSKKTLFERIKQKNDNLSPNFIIKSLSNRSCEIALVVANLKQILKANLLEDNLRTSHSHNQAKVENDDINMMKYTTHLKHEYSLNGHEKVHDKEIRLQDIIDELTITTSISRDVAIKIEQILLKIGSAARVIPGKFRERMVDMFRESELIREELNKNLDMSRNLEEFFAKNAQTLSRQHEDLISLHKRMDEVLQGIRYSQFRCDKFM